MRGMITCGDITPLPEDTGRVTWTVSSARMPLKRLAVVLDFDEFAKATLCALDMWRLPVNPYAIAKEEGIELAPGKYGERFDARIEYIRAAETFILYYRTALNDRTEGRVRFSLAHELGHYYLPGHRDYLLSGRSHNSVADFRHRVAGYFSPDTRQPVIGHSHASHRYS